MIKLSEETKNVPVRQLLTGLRVIDEVFIGSEKVTEMDVVTKIDESESEGEVDVTGGELVVLSGAVVAVVEDSSFSPQDKTMKLTMDMRIMYKTFFIMFIFQ